MVLLFTTTLWAVANDYLALLRIGQQIKDDHTLARDRSDEGLVWYNNNNNNNNHHPPPPHWIPTVWAQNNNPWIITYIRPMKFTWETEAHKPETPAQCLDLIYNWTVFWLWIFCLALLHTKERNLHLHSNEGGLHCSTRFSIPQVQSFHWEWAQSLTYCRSELQLQIKATLRLGGVSFPPLLPWWETLFLALLSRKRSLRCFVFPWVMSNSISVQYKSFGRAKDLQPQLLRRTSSLPREAVLIPRDSIFSYSTRSPWSNNILWPVIYGRGESRDRVGLQVWVSNYYYRVL